MSEVTKQNERDILVAARALIADEPRWCKDAYVSHHVELGSQWSAHGAVQSVTNDLYGTVVWRQAVLLLAEAIPADAVRYLGHDLDLYNAAPGTTHADIMALFDRAIAATNPAAIEKEPRP
jgi:hypothetical protein